MSLGSTAVISDSFTEAAASATGLKRTVTVDTNAGTIVGDDDSANTSFGSTFTTAVEGGVWTVYVRGNLTIPDGSTITVRGGKPFSVKVANDVNVGVGVTIDASAVGAAFGPGGTVGGTGGGGGTGGDGGTGATTVGGGGSGVGDADGFTRGVYTRSYRALGYGRGIVGYRSLAVSDASAVGAGAAAAAS